MSAPGPFKIEKVHFIQDDTVDIDHCRICRESFPAVKDSMRGNHSKSHHQKCHSIYNL